MPFLLPVPDSIPQEMTKRFGGCGKLDNRLHDSALSAFLCRERLSMLKDNRIILNWPEMNRYLNGILYKLLPDSLRDRDYRVYCGRDPGTLPYSFPDGIIIMPAGAVAGIYSEEALAHLIAHEIAHLVTKRHRDNWERYIISLSVPDSPWDIAELLRHMHSRQPPGAEWYADSLALVLLVSAGFRGGDGLHNLSSAYSPDEQPGSFRYSSSKDRTGHKFTDWLLVIPEYAKRSGLFHSLLEKGDLATAVDTGGLFQELRRRAAYEYFDILLRTREYRLCVQSAFTRHLFFPSDSIPVYYICESIRRWSFLHPSQLTVPFLCDNKRYWLGYRSILYDIRFLLPDERERAAIRIRSFTDTTQLFLRDYSDAFQYFSAKADSFDFQPLKLSRILFHYRDTAIRDQLTGRYLKNDPYLQAMLRGFPGLNGKRMLVFPKPEFTYGDASSTAEKVRQKEEKLIIAAWKRISKEFPGYSVIKMEDLEPGTRLRYAEAVSILLTLLEPGQPSAGLMNFPLSFGGPDEELLKRGGLFLLDPSLWEFFNREGISELAFLDLRFVEEGERVRKWLNYFPPYWIYAGLRHAEVTVDGSSGFSFYVNGISYSSKSSRPAFVYSGEVRRRPKRSYMENEIWKAGTQMNERMEKEKNMGFFGKKNALFFSPVPALHNGEFGLEYLRSLGENTMVSAGYSLISSSGSFTHKISDTSGLELSEAFTFSNFGTTISVGFIRTSPYAGVPAPAGPFAGMTISWTSNEFSERSDTSLAEYSYRHQSLAIKGLIGCNWCLPNGLCIKLGMEAGLVFGSVLPMNSYAAFRVPARQYPDHYLWSPRNEFHYNNAVSAVNGTGSAAFATMRLGYSKFWFYPMLKLGVMF